MNRGSVSRPASDNHLRIYGKDRLELGKSAAQASGVTVRLLIKLLSRWLKSRPLQRERLERARSATLMTMRARCPERLLELEGAARGLCVHPDDLLYARVALDTLFPPHCTNFGAVPPATEDGDIMVSWNFDFPPFFKLLMGRSPLFVRELDGTIPYVCLGIPALFGIGTLNGEGLCCVDNAVGMTDAGEGLHPFEMIGRAMETCSTVKGAAEIFEEGPRMATKTAFTGVLMNTNIIWADREANLSLFELSHNHFHEEPAGSEGIIASANHHQFLNRDLSGSFDPTSLEFIAGSYSRLGRMWRLLRENQGRINPEVAKKIVSDHIPDYSLLKEFGIEREWWEDKVDNSTICDHAWNLRKHLLKGEFAKAFEEWSWSCTLYSFQIQPLSYTVWFTNGFPCRNTTRPTYWGRILGAEEAHPAPAIPPLEPVVTKVDRRRRGIFRGDAGPIESLLNDIWYDIVEIVDRPVFKGRAED